MDINDYVNKAQDCLEIASGYLRTMQEVPHEQLELFADLTNIEHELQQAVNAICHALDLCIVD